MVDWKNEMQELPLGKGRKLSDGDTVAILSLGTIGTNVQQAIDVAHYDMIFLKPLDQEIMREVSQKYKTIITIEEGTINGGLGSAVAEWLTERNINARLVRCGVNDTFVDQGTVKQLHELCRIDAVSIEQEVKKHLNNSEI